MCQGLPSRSTGQIRGTLHRFRVALHATREPQEHSLRSRRPSPATATCPPAAQACARGRRCAKAPARGVAGAAHGTFKKYYNRGTTSGTFALTIVAGSRANLTYSGTVTSTGGTGTFRRVGGGGTIVCTTTDRGAYKSCVVNSALTGI